MVLTATRIRLVVARGSFGFPLYSTPSDRFEMLNSLGGDSSGFPLLCTIVMVILIDLKFSRSLLICRRTD